MSNPSKWKSRLTFRPNGLILARKCQLLKRFLKKVMRKKWNGIRNIFGDWIRCGIEFIWVLKQPGNPWNEYIVRVWVCFRIRRGRHLFTSFNKHNTHRMRLFSSKAESRAFVFFITFVLCVCLRCYPSTLLIILSTLNQATAFTLCLIMYASKLNFLFFFLVIRCLSPIHPNTNIHYVWVLYH